MRCSACVGTAVVFALLDAVALVSPRGRHDEALLAAAEHVRSLDRHVDQEGRSLFEFHSRFWMNLHHFLFAEAQRLQGKPAPGEPRLARSPYLPPDGELSGEERRAWDEALAFYTHEVISIPNAWQQVRRARKALTAAETSGKLAEGDLQPGLLAALTKAAPVYRAHWWTQHDRLNRTWIQDVEKLLARHGQSIATKLVTLYQSSWPEVTIPVDVTYIANWAGGYATLQPLHILMTSGDPAYQGFAAMETVFHEASHALIAAVERAVNREAAGSPINANDLTHAILFYTTGEVVKQRLLQQGAATYTPYAYTSYGVFHRAARPYVSPIERYWQPYLEGKVALEQAVADVVLALKQR